MDLGHKDRYNPARRNGRWIPAMTEQPRFCGLQPVVAKYVDELFDSCIHLKRLQSISDATLGVVAGASLAIPIIGHSLAQARGLVTKHATKPVDRLLKT